MVVSLACSHDTVSNPGRELPDSSISSDSSDSGQETHLLQKSQSIETNAIAQKIISQVDSNLIQAQKEIESVLFSKFAKDPKYYTTKSFNDYLYLYSHLFSSWKQRKEGDFFKSFESSILKFKIQFIDSCALNSNCEYFAVTVKKSRTLIPLIVYIANQEKTIKSRIKILGVAYELSGSQRNQELELTYLDSILKISDAIKNKVIVSDPASVKRHFVNFVNIVKLIDWSHLTASNINLYGRIKPWQYRSNTSKPIDLARHHLLTYLPNYFNQSTQVRSSLMQFNIDSLAHFQSKGVDLSNYPAYKTIRIESIDQTHPLALFLALNLYLDNLSQLDASRIMNGINSKDQTISKIFNLSKALIRWKIAQLSIQSTKKIKSLVLERKF